MLCQTATNINVNLQKVLDIVIRVFVEVNVLIITVLSSTSSAAWTAGDVNPRWLTVLRRNCSDVKPIL